MNNSLSEAKVSVIIPAYNVEKYVENCINSVIEQTHKNIEIIVVNDGSTDNTAKVLNEIACKDDRIKIIHQANAGVSAARNVGIKESDGEFIVFVDADDFLSADFIEYMLSLVENTGAEFCLSINCFEKKDEKQVDKETIEKMSNEDATALLLSPVVVVGCWNKIYRRKLLVDNDIYFSENLFYGEGLSFITTVSQIANCVGVGNKKVYSYRKNNETSACTKFDVQKIYNGEKSLFVIKDNMKLKSSKIDTMFQLHLCMFYSGAIVRILSSKLKKEYKTDYKKWLAYVRHNLPKLLLKKEVSMYRKLLLSGVSTWPWLVMKMDNIRRKRNFKNSVEK